MILIPVSTILWALFSYTNVFLTERKAQQILHEFYTEIVPEPLIGRQLSGAGKRMVPFLLPEIEKKDMPRRGYAILALGDIGDRRALPTLVTIFEDKSEFNDIRDAALRAIWHIDKRVGEELAKKHLGEDRYIDRTIELLRESKI
jgi:hypothetical protein